MTTGHPTWATTLPRAVAEGPLYTDGLLSGNGYTASAREQRQLRRRAMQTLECLLRARPCAGQQAGEHPAKSQGWHGFCDACQLLRPPSRCPMQHGTLQSRSGTLKTWGQTCRTLRRPFLVDPIHQTTVVSQTLGCHCTLLGDQFITHFSWSLLRLLQQILLGIWQGIGRSRTLNF